VPGCAHTRWCGVRGTTTSLLVPHAHARLRGQLTCKALAPPFYPPASGREEDDGEEEGGAEARCDAVMHAHAHAFTRPLMRPHTRSLTCVGQKLHSAPPYPAHTRPLSHEITHCELDSAPPYPAVVLFCIYASSQNKFPGHAHTRWRGARGTTTALLVPHTTKRPCLVRLPLTCNTPLPTLETQPHSVNEGVVHAMAGPFVPHSAWDLVYTLSWLINRTGIL